ncbi:hypothetical protein DPMN_042384 [Dreissena polymorpha]|uniref:Uncharacterized protein n=1 Tax=Dreissena polymorpha TaxID=45954 RepID=A0A9D4CYI7_DREPO|nr:hypothetical protein DPMN_042384 [Dreissena polymorpha]
MSECITIQTNDAEGKQLRLKIQSERPKFEGDTDVNEPQLENATDVNGQQLENATDVNNLKLENFTDVNGLRLENATNVNGPQLENVTYVNDLKLDNDTGVNGPRLENATDENDLQLEKDADVNYLKLENDTDLNGLKSENGTDVNEPQLENDTDVNDPQLKSDNKQAVQVTESFYAHCSKNAVCRNSQQKMFRDQVNESIENIMFLLRNRFPCAQLEDIQYKTTLTLSKTGEKNTIVDTYERGRNMSECITIQTNDAEGKQLRLKSQSERPKFEGDTDVNEPQLENATDVNGQQFANATDVNNLKLENYTDVNGLRLENATDVNGPQLENATYVNDLKLEKYTGVNGPRLENATDENDLQLEKDADVNYLKLENDTDVNGLKSENGTAVNEPQLENDTDVNDPQLKNDNKQAVQVTESFCTHCSKNAACRNSQQKMFWDQVNQSIENIMFSLRNRFPCAQLEDIQYKTTLTLSKTGEKYKIVDTLNELTRTNSIGEGDIVIATNDSVMILDLNMLHKRLKDSGTSFQE